jgi:hypothetical protein
VHIETSKFTAKPTIRRKAPGRGDVASPGRSLREFFPYSSVLFLGNHGSGSTPGIRIACVWTKSPNSESSWLAALAAT